MLIMILMLFSVHTILHLHTTHYRQKKKSDYFYCVISSFTILREKHLFQQYFQHKQWL